MSSTITKEEVEEIVDIYLKPHIYEISQILEYIDIPSNTHFNVDEIEELIESLVDMNADIRIAITRLRSLT